MSDFRTIYGCGHKAASFLPKGKAGPVRNADAILAIILQIENILPEVFGGCPDFHTIDFMGDFLSHLEKFQTAYYLCAREYCKIFNWKQ